MAKRFTDTNKQKKPFRRGLEGAYKLLWDYLCDDCDHAGIWIVDFEIAQIYVGADMPVNKVDALKFFNKDETRIIEFDQNKKWFIPSFIDFQYGELNPENRVHKSIIIILNKYNLLKDNKPITSPLEGAKDKDKDMDKDKEMDKDITDPEVEILDEYCFGNFWDLYDKKTGDKTIIERKYNRLTNEVRVKIFEHIPKYIKSQSDKQYRKNPETYINQKGWEDEIIMQVDKKSMGKIDKVRQNGIEMAKTIQKKYEKNDPS